MANMERSSGVSISLPDTFEVTDFTGKKPLRRSGSRAVERSGVPPIVGDKITAELVRALQDQELNLVDVPSFRPTVPVRRVRAGRETEASIALNIEKGESAVVLLERDGVYTWHYEGGGPAVRGDRNTSPKVLPKRRVVIRFDLFVPGAVSGVKRRGAAEFLVGPWRAFIFKFVAKIILGQAVPFLERNVEPGLVSIGSLEPAQWTRPKDLSRSRLPKDRPAKILLLVHGTFSSTSGGYGALTATREGRSFLTSAIGFYDLIIGFDHPTLSVDPLVNAKQILASLKSAQFTIPPEIHAVAHSRGALVLRCLTDYLFPKEGALRIQKAVFVGGTNAGTLLASPKNWKSLIDLYTNLAVAGCKIVQMLPGATATAGVVKECIVSLGDFVRYIATTALEEGAVPGLAAMMPRGPFVKNINKSQLGQPTPATSEYYVVTSYFDMTGLRAGEIFSLSLIKWLANLAADQLMVRENDLVVNVDSMSCFDSGGGKFVKDAQDFGRNSKVFHTIYFAQPEVVGALRRWLMPGKNQSPSNVAVSQKRGNGRAGRATVTAQKRKLRVKV